MASMAGLPGLPGLPDLPGEPHHLQPVAQFLPSLPIAKNDGCYTAESPDSNDSEPAP